MSEHPWASDPEAQAAVRAAEDAAAAERTPLPDHRDLPQAVKELRERVARLENAARADIAAADSQIDELERASLNDDQTIRTLKDRVAELESAAKLAPAANAGGEVNCPATPDSSQEPVAWGVRRKSGTWWNTCFERRDRMESCIQGADAEDAAVLPLYAAPQPPRGWLTEEEREAVKSARLHLSNSDCLDEATERECKWASDVFRRLLARSTPPRVRRPKRDYPPMPGGVVHTRDKEWIAAIREAGGEVE